MFFSLKKNIWKVLFFFQKKNTEKFRRFFLQTEKKKKFRNDFFFFFFFSFFLCEEDILFFEYTHKTRFFFLSENFSFFRFLSFLFVDASWRFTLVFLFLEIEKNNKNNKKTQW